MHYVDGTYNFLFLNLPVHKQPLSFIFTADDLILHP